MLKIDFDDWMNNMSAHIVCGEINHHSLLHTIQMFILLVTVVGGLVGNGLVLLIFFSKTIAKQPSNVFIVFLASSGSTFLIVVFVQQILFKMKCLFFSPDAPLDIMHQNNFFV